MTFRMRVRSAPLNLVLEANGIPTGDQLLAEQRAAEAEALVAEKAALPKYMNGYQRRALKRVLRKGALK